MSRIIVATSGLATVFLVTAWAKHHHSTVLPLPIEAPTGTVELESYGIAEVATDNNQAIALLHVRITVENVGDAVPWRFDLTTATIGFDRKPRVHARFVNSDLATLPIAIVARGDRRVIDMYFPAVEPASFDFACQFRTATGHRHSARPLSRVLETHARFVREDAATQTVDATPPLGWGASWWAHPAVAWFTIDRFGLRHAPNIVDVTLRPHGPAYRVHSVSFDGVIPATVDSRPPVTTAALAPR